MAHPVTQAEILASLERSAATVVATFSAIPHTAFFDGDSERWAPAHHVVHLTRACLAVGKGLRAEGLAPHASARSRTFAEIRDAAASSLGAAPQERLAEMGRTVVIPEGASQADIVAAFAAASAAMREAAAAWSEEALDRHVMPHPLMGLLSVREMLFFFVVHEQHHRQGVLGRLEAARPPGAER